jgi:hypothetical protein
MQIRRDPRLIPGRPRPPKPAVPPACTCRHVVKTTPLLDQLHDATCPWEQALPCTCPNDAEGARAAHCLACRITHQQPGCAWYQFERAEPLAIALWASSHGLWPLRRP